MRGHQLEMLKSTIHLILQRNPQITKIGFQDRCHQPLGHLSAHLALQSRWADTYPL